MDSFGLLARLDSGMSMAALLIGLLMLISVAGMDRGKGKLGLRRFLANTTIALFFLAATVKLVIGVLLTAQFGLLVSGSRILVTAPVLFLPALGLLLLTRPALRRVGKEVRANGRHTAQTRAAAAAPILVAPVYVALVAAGADLRFDYFVAPQSPYVDSLLFVAGVLAITAALSTLLQRWLAGDRATGRRTFAPRAARSAAVLAFGVAPVVVAVVYSATSSRLPDLYSMAHHSMPDQAAGHHMGHRSAHGVTPISHQEAPQHSLTEYAGPKSGAACARFRLTARTATLNLSGHREDALTFNGRAPGPVLRVEEGQLVQVTLHNENVTDGVTIHWHGVEVPNAEDGVAGVTQNAVPVGEDHVYRFRVHQVGTLWYHSHQHSEKETNKGLFGALIVEPAHRTENVDLVAIGHQWTKTATINDATVDQQRVAPGQRVRLRLVNSDSWPMRFAVHGSPFRVAAIDANAVNQPGEVRDQGLLVAAGGRNDITFTMPDHPVTVRAFIDAHNRAYTAKGDPAMVLSPSGRADAAPAEQPESDVDFTDYGKPKATPFGADSDFDVDETYYLDYMFFGFFDGGLKTTYSINGKLLPNIPSLLVREGDLVKVTFVNRSIEDHPMHPHGHTMLVLSRNGEDVTGSPWWTDTLNVAPGETYEVAFRANNPGVWMDHCHNLAHAAGGMMMHIGYEGVTSPFRAGRTSGNVPE